MVLERRRGVLSANVAIFYGRGVALVFGASALVARDLDHFGAGATSIIATTVLPDWDSVN